MSNDNRENIINLIKKKDPYQVLSRDNFISDLKVYNNGNRYAFRISSNRKDSISFKLNNSGNWSYTDYTGTQLATPNGSIIDYVMSTEKIDFNSAIIKLADIYSLDYNPKNLKINYIKNKSDINQQIEEIKKINQLKKEMAKIDINYNSIQLVKENSAAHDFIKERNINNIAPFLFSIDYDVTKKIKNKYKNEKNNKDYIDYTYNVKGVGVLNGIQSLNMINNYENIIGGDVHKFDISKGKTESFLPKNITVIPGKNNKYIISESKMDYSAAYSSGLLNALGFKFDINSYKNMGSTIILLNGTSNISLANKYIEKTTKLNNINKTDIEVSILSQNDSASLLAFSKMIRKIGVDTFNYIKYNKGEKDFDINDITKEYGDNINSFKDRIYNGNINSFINSNKHLLNNKMTLEKLIEDIEKYQNNEGFDLKNMKSILDQINFSLKRLKEEGRKHKDIKEYRTPLTKIYTNYVNIIKKGMDELLTISGNNEILDVKRDVIDDYKKFLKKHNITKISTTQGIEKNLLSKLKEDLEKNNELFLNLLDKISINESIKITNKINNEGYTNDTSNSIQL